MKLSSLHSCPHHSFEGLSRVISQVSTAQCQDDGKKINELILEPSSHLQTEVTLVALGQDPVIRHLFSFCHLSSWPDISLGLK